MKKKLLSMACVLLLATGALAACGSQTDSEAVLRNSETAETSLAPQANWRDFMLSSAGATTIESELSGSVQVMEDGTQVMLSPKYVNTKGMYGFHYETGEGNEGNDGEWNDEMAVTGTGFSDLNYNVEVLQADQRGCKSCHVDLIEALSDHDSWHAGISGGNAWLDIKSTGVEVCISCHTTDLAAAQCIPDFGEMIHSMHDVRVGEEKASCFQCHTTVAHGWEDAEGITNMLGQEFEGSPTEWVLWDEVKYDQMKGVALSHDITGEFSFTQDEITPTEQLFNETWLQYSSREMADVAGVDSSQLGDTWNSIDENTALKDDIFNNWQFGIKGAVSKEKTWSLEEILAEAPSETVIMKDHCGINKLGGWSIGNVEVTGVPVEWFIEQAGGVTDGAKFVDGESLDSSEIDGLNMGLFIGSTPLEWLDEHNVLVVYEINGERLNWAQGFPLQLWVGGAAADAYMKQLTNLVITTDETRMGTNTTEEGICMAPLQYPGFGGVRANCAITNTYEGQVVEAGKPYSFKGYLDGWYEQVGGIMVSMDNGETWTKFDTPDTDVEKWVSWEFTWDVPDVDMAYVLDVKPYLADGSTTPASVRVMVNAVQGGVVVEGGSEK